MLDNKNFAQFNKIVISLYILVVEVLCSVEDSVSYSCLSKINRKNRM